jgi:HSP20 family protein
MQDRDRPGELEEIFEILVTSFGRRGAGVPADKDLCWRPATDAYETEDRFVVQMELAGAEPNRVEVFTDGEALYVRGMRQDVSEPGKKHFHKMEINVGPFARRIPLTVDVDPNSAEARYRSGFLVVSFRKGRPRDGERRRIEVNR